MIFKNKNIFIILVVLAMLFCSTGLLAKVKTKTQQLKGQATRYFRSVGPYLQLGPDGYPRALENYQLVLETYPDHVESIKGIAEIYYETALYEFDLDDAETIELFTQSYEYFDRVINAIHSIEDWEVYVDSKKNSFVDLEADSKRKKESIWVNIFKIAEEYYTLEDEDGEPNEKYDLAKAEDLYLFLIDLDPTRTESYIRLAAIEKGKGNDEKSTEYFVQLYEVDPTNPLVVIKIATEYELLGDFEDAKVYYQKFLDLEPNSVDGHTSLARMSLEMNELEAALLHYENAHNISPENADIIANTVNVASSLDNEEKVIIYLKKLVALEQTDINYSILCSRLYGQKDWEELITYAMLWHEMNDENPDPVQFIILAAQGLNNTSLAREYEEIYNKLR